MSYFPLVMIIFLLYSIFTSSLLGKRKLKQDRVLEKCWLLQGNVAILYVGETFSPFMPLVTSNTADYYLYRTHLYC